MNMVLEEPFRAFSTTSIKHSQDLSCTDTILFKEIHLQPDIRKCTVVLNYLSINMVINDSPVARLAANIP